MFNYYITISLKFANSHKDVYLMKLLKNNYSLTYRIIFFIKLFKI